jgi:hypothetical protein
MMTISLFQVNMMSLLIENVMECQPWLSVLLLALKRLKKKG